MRIGLYGGSFDPIHRGHVAAAVAVREARGLDEVRLLPAARAPHKSGAAASFEDRLAMASLAVADEPGLFVSAIEGERDGPSYTYETVAELSRREPDVAWELLAGADMIEDMPRWYRAADLVARVTVVGFARPSADTAAARAAFTAAFGPDRLAWVEIEPFRASSTAIRRMLAEGGDASELLAPAVFTYATSKQLYRG